MKLTIKALEAIKGNTRLHNLVALEFGKSVYTVSRWISENDDNGPLTTAKAVQIIQKESALKKAEILEESSVKETAK